MIFDGKIRGDYSEIRYAGKELIDQFPGLDIRQKSPPYQSLNIFYSPMIDDAFNGWLETMPNHKVSDILHLRIKSKYSDEFGASTYACSLDGKLVFVLPSFANLKSLKSNSQAPKGLLYMVSELSFEGPEEQIKKLFGDFQDYVGGQKLKDLVERGRQKIISLNGGMEFLHDLDMLPDEVLDFYSLRDLSSAKPAIALSH